MPGGSCDGSGSSLPACWSLRLRRSSGGGSGGGRGGSESAPPRAMHQPQAGSMERCARVLTRRLYSRRSDWNSRAASAFAGLCAVDVRYGLSMQFQNERVCMKAREPQR